MAAKRSTGSIDDGCVEQTDRHTRLVSSNVRTYIGHVVTDGGVFRCLEFVFAILPTFRLQEADDVMRFWLARDCGRGCESCHASTWKHHIARNQYGKPRLTASRSTNKENKDENPFCTVKSGLIIDQVPQPFTAAVTPPAQYTWSKTRRPTWQKDVLSVLVKRTSPNKTYKYILYTTDEPGYPSMKHLYQKRE